MPVKAVLALLAIVLWGARAHAALCTATASMVAFGAYDPVSPNPTDTIGTLTVTCSGPAATVINLQIKLAGDGQTRHLNGPRAVAAYQLFIDPARSRVWGDCTGATSCVSDSFILGQSTTRRTYPIYSRMPPHQRVPPEGFSDAVVVLLNY